MRPPEVSNITSVLLKIKSGVILMKQNFAENIFDEYTIGYSDSQRTLLLPIPVITFILSKLKRIRYYTNLIDLVEQCKLGYEYNRTGTETHTNTYTTLIHTQTHTIIIVLSIQYHIWITLT